MKPHAVPMQNEPQLTAEMEKRLEKFLTDIWGWSYEYGEWLDSESQPIGGIKDIKRFLATVLEEQRMKTEVETGIHAFGVTMEEITKARADERKKVLEEVLEEVKHLTMYPEEQIVEEHTDDDGNLWAISKQPKEFPFVRFSELRAKLNQLKEGKC